MLKKGLEAVQLVALRGEMSIREIAAEMGLPKSTAHRLIASLVSVRLLQPVRRADGDAYCVGSLVGELSGAAFVWRPLVQHAQPELTALRDETGETAAIHMLYGNRRVLLDQVVSQHSLRWVYGHHMAPMPLRAGATGKMFLAMLEPQDLETLLRREASEPPAGTHAAPDLKALRAQIEIIRERGCSISADELNPGITSIAVPVPRPRDDRLPRAVVSLAAPSIRVTDAICQRYVKRLGVAARNIARGMAREGNEALVAPVR